MPLKLIKKYHFIKIQKNLK